MDVFSLCPLAISFLVTNGLWLEMRGLAGRGEGDLLAAEGEEKGSADFGDRGRPNTNKAQQQRKQQRKSSNFEDQVVRVPLPREQVERQEGRDQVQVHILATLQLT